MEKLRKYIKPSLVMRHRYPKSDKYYKSGFKNCEQEDFMNLHLEDKSSHKPNFSE